MPDELEPDEEARKQWEQMPKGEPSRRALPPATGGNRLGWWIIGITLVLVVLGLLERAL